MSSHVSVTAFCLMACTFFAPPLHSSEPNLKPAPGADKTLIDRETTVRRESLKLLRDAISARLREVRPGTQDLDEIAASLFLHHRIIGLGEATHGTADIFTMKIELMKSLVKAGSRALVFELSVTGAEYLDDYVCGRVAGNPSMAEVLENCRMYQTWKVPEVANMILWIRDFNQEHPTDSIRIYGVDSQMPGVDRLLGRIGAKRPEFDTKGAQARDTAFSAAYRKLGMSIFVGKQTPGADADKLFEERHQFVTELRSVIQGVSMGVRERKMAELELRSLDQDCDSGREYVTAARMVPNGHSPMEFLFANANLRDGFMAENFAFTEKNIIGDHARIMVWAHSGHLARRPSVDLEANATLHAFGVSLAQWYGDEYHVVNVTVGGGTTRGYDEDNLGPDLVRKPLAFKVQPGSLEGVVSSIRPKGMIFFETRGLAMGDAMLDYLSIGAGLSSKEGAGLVHGTVADFDSHIFIPSGKASADLKP